MLININSCNKPQYSPYNIKTHTMSKVETVNFKIGDGFGITLMNIAQEHLLYSHDPQKAMDTITKSLVGCPDDIALKILIGEMVLPVDEESQQVICVPREDFHDTIFPKIDLKDWLWRQSRRRAGGLTQRNPAHGSRIIRAAPRFNRQAADCSRSA